MSTIEVLIILTVCAAAVVAFMAMPSRRGQAKQYLLEGFLTDEQAPEAEQFIEVDVRDDGRVRLTRHGLQAMLRARSNGQVPPDLSAVSLAVMVTGFNVEIEERVTTGAPGSYGSDPDTAVFVLDFLAPERYHVKYNSDTSNRMAAFTLAVRPGLKLAKTLA